MAGDRLVAVVGSRALPSSWAPQVRDVVRFFLARGWGIGSGGARGADRFALEGVVGAGVSACRRSVVFLPGAHSATPGGALGAFTARGGRVVPGSGVGRAALLGRSRRLACASSGVVAFLWGPSRGSLFTVWEAIRSGKAAAVVVAGGGAALPQFAGGRWLPCTFGSVAAFRWVPDPLATLDDPAPKVTELRRIFVVPEGEPMHSLMAHISSLSGGERLWFEQGLLVGEMVVMPHEAVSDTPAFLALPRLRRRFRCTTREAAGLAELFLAVEASPEVVAFYQAEARRRSVAAVSEELVDLVARLALAEEVAATDMCEEAERLGDAVEDLTVDAQLAARAVAPEAEGAMLAWHSLGSVQPSTQQCAVCGDPYEADDESADIPACPECGVPDTWESRQGPAFRALVGEIDGCSSLAELAVIGKRLYALALSRDQAGVAWTHYALRKAALEAAITLGAAPRALMSAIAAAGPRELAALGARLYRLQHAGEPSIRPEEWRRIWRAYHARRAPRAA